MKKIGLLLSCSAIMAVIALSSCNSVQSKNSDGATITDSDNGKTIHLKLDEQFNLTLNANPTTGYSWETLPYNESVIKFIKSDYSANSSMAGSNGIRTIKFQAIGKGSTELKLTYIRVWEKNQPPVKVYDIKVVVE